MYSLLKEGPQDEEDSDQNCNFFLVLYLNNEKLLFLMLAFLYLMLGAKVGKSSRICLIYLKHFCIKRREASLVVCFVNLLFLLNVICLLQIPYFSSITEAGEEERVRRRIWRKEIGLEYWSVHGGEVGEFCLPRK